MPQIDDWLEGLDLGRYAELFARNEIDWEVLPELDAHDLAELGIPLGHRKKLLKAIAALSGGSSAPPPGDTDPATAGVPVAGPERRHLTVLFCDLVGSTELSEQFDPEDLRQILSAYQDRCAGIIARMDGFVSRYMGDGILIYFGYPRAHEDDAERALRASLGIVEAIGNLPTHSSAPLQVRVGVATGLVVVGDIIGSEVSQEIAAIGAPPNIAARLQAQAEPDSVVVDEATYRLTNGLFDFADLGRVSLRGLAGPNRLWRVLHEKDLESRFQATRGASLVPFVNREHEIALMLDRWAEVREGEGQLLLLSGESGIGKSRLVQVFENRLADEHHLALRYSCSHYYANSALHPFLDQIRRAAGVTASDTASDKLRKLAAHLTGTLDDADQAARLFAYLLSSPGDYRTLLAGDPENIKEAASKAIVAQLTTLSKKGPLLVVVEDAHWIDPTSLELLEALAERIQSFRMLMIVTFRLEGAPPLSGIRQATLLKLNRLRRPDCQAIVEILAEHKALPTTLVEEIIARADGVALYLEEITKAVLESETLVDRGDHWESIGAAPARIVPATLKASLASRLDRAPGTREVAQIASVVGREFAREMLAAVSRLPESTLEDSLSRLVDAGMLQLGGIPPNASYRFKHALLQEAAYESLLRSRRKELHARVAEVLERQFPETAATEPALLAHHFMNAGLSAKAIEQFLEAGELALARSAMSEAITVLRSALGLLPELDDEAARRHWELRIQVSLGTAYRATRAPSAVETGQAWDRARALCRDEADAPYLLQALFGQFLYRQGIADLARARQLGHDLLAFGQRAAIPSAIAAAYGAIGRSAFGQGDLGAARANLEQALAVETPADDLAANGIHRAESRVLDLCYLSWTLYAQGQTGAALQRSRESIELAKSLAQSYALAVALGNACYLHHFRRDVAKIGRHAEEVVALAAEKSFPAWRTLGQIFRGWVLCQSGEADKGIPLLERALEEHRATGELLEVPYFIGLLAESLWCAARPREALIAVEQALALMQDGDERWMEPELLRLQGELLLSRASDDPAPAEACFTRALEVARAQDAGLWELRAALCLARNFCSQGDSAKAAALLEPILERLRETAEAADLAEARAVLASAARPLDARVGR